MKLSRKQDYLLRLESAPDEKFRQRLRPISPGMDHLSAGVGRIAEDASQSALLGERFLRPRAQAQDDLHAPYDVWLLEDQLSAGNQNRVEVRQKTHRLGETQMLDAVNQRDLIPRRSHDRRRQRRNVREVIRVVGRISVERRVAGERTRTREK